MSPHAQRVREYLEIERRLTEGGKISRRKVMTMIRKELWLKHAKLETEKKVIDV